MYPNKVYEYRHHHVALNLCFILRYWCFVSVDTVDSITPDKVRGLRDLLNSSAMDIMYYNSPLYRDEVRITRFQKPKIMSSL